jgi:tetratricopeptide (TPR) repeat protein
LTAAANLFKWYYKLSVYKLYLAEQYSYTDMGFFANLFGLRKKRGKQAIPASSLTDVDIFDKEFLAAASRYTSRPREEMSMRVRSEETNEVIPFAVAFPEAFEEWKQVKSVWDKRGIIYKVLDNSIGESLKLWQVIERYNIDRHPEQALKVAAEHATGPDLTDANFHMAVARSYFILTRYKEAEERAEKALSLAPNHLKAKILLGDIWHYTHKQERAHDLYNEVLNIKMANETRKSLTIPELVGFEHDLLHSPVYALTMLRSDAAISEPTWDAIACEFYHYPHYRSAHAAFLVQKGDYMKAFAKFMTLSREMPWFKEGVINSYSLMQQLELEPQMAEDKARLEEIIRKEHWTV